MWLADATLNIISELLHAYFSSPVLLLYCCLFNHLNSPFFTQDDNPLARFQVFKSSELNTAAEPIINKVEHKHQSNITTAFSYIPQFSSQGHFQPDSKTQWLTDHRIFQGTTFSPSFFFCSPAHLTAPLSLCLCLGLAQSYSLQLYLVSEPWAPGRPLFQITAS